MKIKKTELDNGLKILISQDDSYPVVSFHLWVGAGSADETDAMAGVSHFLEHMIFKGTKTRSPQDVNLKIEGLGGDLNAYTTFDNTVYHLTMASRYWRDGLEVLADIIANPVFPGDGMESERKVILEEIKEGEDHPELLLSQELFKQAYKKENYRRPIIGYRKTVKSLKRTSLVGYYRRSYVARNMILIACGDVPRKEFIDAAGSFFRGIKEGRVLKRRKSMEKKKREFDYSCICKGRAEHILSLGFQIPSVFHHDSPALDILSIILGEGESSRLNQDIVTVRSVARDAGSYTFTPMGTGLFMIRVSPFSEKFKDALTGVVENIEKLKRNSFFSDELERARITVLKELVFQEETVHGKARKIGYFQNVFGDPRYEDEYIKKIHGIEAEDLMKAAGKYLDRANLTLGVLLPEEKRPLSKKAVGKILSDAGLR